MPDQFQLNPYNEQEYKNEDNSWWLDILSKDVLVYWNRDGRSIDLNITPREMFYYRGQSSVPFYYLSFLRTTPDVSIVDIGCGINMFKPFFKNLLGVDTNTRGADIYSNFEDWYLNNQESYSSAFSMNALHFRPLSQLEDIILKFATVIKPEGFGYVSFNLIRFLENSHGEQWDSYDKITTHINSVISSLSTKVKLVVVDQTYSDPATLNDLSIRKDRKNVPEGKRFASGFARGYNNEFEGNIRIVFQTKGKK